VSLSEIGDPAWGVKRKRRSLPRQARIESAIAKPVVKWAGGKARLLPVIRRHLPRTFHRYFEPFCGGAALYFSLAPEMATLGDLAVDLIETYSAIACDVESVIRELRVHALAHAADRDSHYYSMRALWNLPDAELGTAQRAALFLYLNRTCFNGLWRVNREGQFNVPIGDYKNPAIERATELRAAAKLLGTTRAIVAGDYRATTGAATRGDLAYLDSPYDGETFTSYTRERFDAEAQGELAQHARSLAKRGVHVLMSNHDTWLIRELYPESEGWHVSPISAPRSVAASGSKRADAREVLISSYGPEVMRGAQ
jgi:DNA adenine methylase